MSDNAIPEIIRAAGERAVAAYQTFFDVIMQGSHARDVYHDACGRFCEWAEERGLTLAGLTADDAATYTKAANTASPAKPIRLDLTALLSVFQHLARAGVLRSNPFENPAARLKPSMPQAPSQPPLAETAAAIPSVAVPTMADRADHSATLGESKDGESAVTVGGETDLVPELILAAGEKAVTAYRSYLDDPVRNASTRKLYCQRARRFFCWAQSRGLTLETITEANVAAYAGELAAAKSQHEVSIYLTPVRGVFRRFVSAGVLATNPCSQKEYRTPCAIAKQEAEGANDGRFPLLALMAMLANMEEKSMEVVFGDEDTARNLLEFVRWRDGRQCTRCGAMADEPPNARIPEGGIYCCPACGCTYAVTDGSPFEELTVPLQHALFLLFSFYLSNDPPPERDSLAHDRGLSASDIMTVGLRVEEALARVGLAAGEALHQAVERKNRELTQDEVGRGIMEYGQLVAAHKELMQAKAENRTVDGLPPGMTLDGALADVEARIAEHDLYVITMENGYLVSRLAEAVENQAGEQVTRTQEPADER